jgi:hypothetical protein
VDAYFLHIKAVAVINGSEARRLLAEQPRATGLAVAGMPSSAPGMDVADASDSYDVTLFGASKQQRYARYRGLREISN